MSQPSRMRRLPEAGMLPDLLSSGDVDARLARRIGRTVATFHASAATGPGVDQHGSLDAVSANWVENFVQMEPFVGRTVASEINDHIRTYVDDFLTRPCRAFRAARRGRAHPRWARRSARGEHLYR